VQNSENEDGEGKKGGLEVREEKKSKKRSLEFMAVYLGDAVDKSFAEC
jgi:hypothetical protein